MISHNKKKILYIVEADLKSGAGKCAFELVKRIKKYSDFAPIVLTQHPNDLNDYCTKNGIKNFSTHYARTCSLGMGRLGWVIAFFMRPILNRLSYHRLKKNINLANIDLIHSNAISIDFGAYLHKKTGIPHIWHIRDFLIFEKKWTPIIWDLPSYMRKYSSKIITVSDSLKEHLISYDCKINAIQTIYDGIEIPKEKKNNDSIQNKKILNVACVGYICELKGQEVLIDAITLLPNEKKQLFRFFFWGEFDNRIKTRIMRKIHENKLESIISFCGFSTNIFTELKNMDIGVQPSHSEGFSRVTAEYMAAGLCSIAAKEGAIPELIQNQENGFLYEDYNAKELADLLLFCYDNQDVMTSCAKKAKEKALEKYDIEKNFKTIMNIYKEVLQPTS